MTFQIDMNDNFNKSYNFILLYTTTVCVSKLISRDYMMNETLCEKLNDEWNCNSKLRL